MSKARLEIKVGIFVFVALVLLAILALQFSKGMSLFRSTYDIQLKTGNVGGLKVRAGVLMAGVQVGAVEDITLAPEGTNVLITLRIYEQHRVHRDAVFTLEQSGFLGDQYVSIRPTANAMPPFLPGETAVASEAFNLQEAARAATGFIQRLDTTATKLNETIDAMQKHLLNETTLTSLAATAGNLRQVSSDAVVTVSNLNVFVASNAPVYSATGTNLNAFSRELKELAGSLQGVVDTNSPGLGRAVQNVEDASSSLKAIMADVQAGKGLAGKLVADEALAQNVAQISENLSVTTSNLTVTSSNLNRLGLWGILWAKPGPKTPPPSATKPLTTPKNPYK